MSLQNWVISHDYKDYVNEILYEVSTIPYINDSYSLDVEKEKKGTIEEHVYEVVKFHFNRLNLTYDKEKYQIEFYVERNFKNDFFHLECDRMEKQKKIFDHKCKRPFMTCITFLDDNICPTVITNITDEMMKYKDFEQIDIAFSFPKKLKHIAYDGGKYYNGTYDVFGNNTETTRYSIHINFWDTQPQQLYPYYNTNHIIARYKATDMVFTDANNGIIKFIEDIDDVVMDDILFNPTTDSFKVLTQKLDSSEKLIMNDVYFKKLKPRGMESVIENYRVDISIPKFIQRLYYESFYKKEICNWMIHEINQYSRTNTCNENKYPSYSGKIIFIEKVSSIFSYFLISFETIIKRIKQGYGLDDNYKVNIIDLFIIKCEPGVDSVNNMNHENVDLIINIGLTTCNSSQSNIILFDDDIRTELNAGDMIIYSGLTKISYSVEIEPVYRLVAFLQITN